MGSEHEHISNPTRDAVFIIDSSRKIIHASDSIRSFIGRKPGDVLNKYCYNVLTSELCFKNCPFDYVAENKVSFTKLGVKLYNDEGDYKEVSYGISPYQDENMAGIMVKLRDTTPPLDFLQTSDAENYILNYKRHFLDAILNTSDEGMVFVDKNFRIIEFNRAAEKLTGYKKEELYGQPCPNICNISQDFSCPFDFCMKNNRTEMEAHTSINRKDAAPVVVRLRLKVLFDQNNKVIGGIAILMHIVDFISAGAKDFNFFGVVGSSEPMQPVYDLIKAASITAEPVLITGESGTGKELAATVIHKLKTTSGAPLIKVNCAALPDNMLERELFGYEKGAFEGAVTGKAGKFELAENKCILLDQISETSLAIQSKLLRLIKDQEFERPGSGLVIKCNAKIIATTQKDLKKEVDRGVFNEELFFGLGSFILKIPPLRERVEDIPLLANYFLNDILKSYSRKLDKKVLDISLAAMEVLQSYSWPGNVRELKNTIEGLYFLAPDERTSIKPSDLPSHIRGQALQNKFADNNRSEKERIIQALMMENFDKTKAAKSLGMSRVTLWRKLNAHGIKMGDLIK